MKHLLTILFVFSIIASATAQKKAPLEELDLQRDGKYYQVNHMDPFTGTAFQDYPSGKKKTRAEFKNGMIHGKAIMWYENGKKLSQIEYKNGIKVGSEIHWYDNGARSLEVNYDEEGLATGVCKEWYQNEALKSEGKFVKGIEEGLHKWYFKDGKTDQTVEYVGGKANGKIKLYYESGKLKSEADYVDGEPHGKLTLYYENNKKKSVLHYENGVEEGAYKFWSKKGLLLEEKTYKAGEEIEHKNYRSCAIKTKDGYLQVFNEAKSFFTIHINQGWVRSRQSKDITYVVDDFVLQLFNYANSRFDKENSLSGAALLNAQVDYEIAFIEKQTGENIQVNKEQGSTSRGIDYVYWKFETPNWKANRSQSLKTVIKEHYISVICNEQVLMLYVPQTKGNDEATISAALKKIINNLEIKEARIDVNDLRKQVRENAGLPPVPANESFKDYKDLKK